MKIKLTTKYGSLNPLPIMGKDAFVAFVRDWYNEVAQQGSFFPYAIIPNSRDFREWDHDCPGNTAELFLGKAGEQGIWPIVDFKGYCDNLLDRKDKTRIVLDSLTKSGDTKLSELDTSRMSDNFVFTSLLRPDDESARRLANCYKVEKRVLDEMLHKTKQRVYERSAMVHRGLFGGYSF